MNDEFWLARVKIAQKRGQTVGLVQGSWDLFHIGHLRYIMKARSLCDFLVIAMDSDEKIQKRKGPTRPIIPEDERSEFVKLLDIADTIVIKPADEPKWNLIKTIKPDVLIAIKENYSDDEIEQLKQYCGDVAVLPRQARTSTSDKIRQITINGRLQGMQQSNKKAVQAAIATEQRVMTVKDLAEPIPQLLKTLRNSTDEVCPASACCFWNGEWFFGVNLVDPTIPQEDIEERSELFYNTVEHAEINLLKKMGEIRTLEDTPIYTSLFPCDTCMKVLADKKVKEIYYLEDHPNRNWSKRSHKLAEEKGIKTICLLE